MCAMPSIPSLNTLSLVFGPNPQYWPFYFDLLKQVDLITSHLSPTFPSMDTMSFTNFIQWRKDKDDWSGSVPIEERLGLTMMHNMGVLRRANDYKDCLLLGLEQVQEGPWTDYNPWNRVVDSI